MLQEAAGFIKKSGKVTLFLATVNILVFIWLSATGDTNDASFMLRRGAFYTPAFLSGDYYRLVTGMFLHFGLMHLVYNMLCLLTLGNILEEAAGPVRYLLIYFLGGIAGHLATMWADIYTRYGSMAVSAGASGACFAVIGALLWIVLRSGGRSAIPSERMLLMTALMVLQGFTEKNTNNIAHVGGLAAGFVLAAVMQCQKRKRRYS